jgi:hypothetical protein
MDIPYHVYPIFRHTHLAPWVGTIACPSSTQFFFLSCLTLKYLKYETSCGIATMAMSKKNHPVALVCGGPWTVNDESHQLIYQKIQDLKRNMATPTIREKH